MKTFFRGWFSVLAISCVVVSVAAGASANSRYAEMMLADKPALYWPLHDADAKTITVDVVSAPVLNPAAAATLLRLVRSAAIDSASTAVMRSEPEGRTSRVAS